MRMTRHKQFLYEGGLKVPLIIADFSKSKPEIKAGTINESLISGIDLGVSSLNLAGIPIPDYMTGRTIFDKSSQAREFVISTRDRCDFTIDRIRSVRSKEFKKYVNFKLHASTIFLFRSPLFSITRRRGIFYFFELSHKIGYILKTYFIANSFDGKAPIF